MLITGLPHPGIMKVGVEIRKKGYVLWVEKWGDHEIAAKNFILLIFKNSFYTQKSINFTIKLSKCVKNVRKKF